MGRGTRPRAKSIEVWLTGEEKTAIEARAVSAGLSASAFLRTLGLHQPIRSRADQDAVLALMRINGDLGRLGGLLKLWLSERPGQGARIVEVRRVLDDIQAARQEMRRVASQVRRP